MLVRVWPSQCVQKWKAWNWIPTFLWLYDKRVRNAAALHMSFHATLTQPEMVAVVVSSAVRLHSTIIPYIRFSQGSFTLHIFGPPTRLYSRQPAQSKRFPRSLLAKDSTQGSGKGANHMLAPTATKTSWQKGTGIFFFFFPHQNWDFKSTVLNLYEEHHPVVPHLESTFMIGLYHFLKVAFIRL